MKNTKIFVLALMLASIFISGCFSDREAEEKKAAKEGLTVVTSFYPVYLSAINVTKGVEGISVINMTKPQAGCLHDYQLMPEDIKTLEKADVFIINGAGMESFIDKVIKQRKDLTVVDASQNIPLLEFRGEKNPHVWVSVSNAILQVKNIAEQLKRIDPGHKAQYEKNASLYVEKLENLRARARAAADALPNKDIVTFHEAFPYFAEELGLHVVDVIAREPGSEPSPKELEDTIHKVKAANVKALFAEPQYSAGAADLIARESGARVYTLDPVVTGTADDQDYDAYIRIMQKNIQVLQEALQ